jgi:hypothetical protein
MYFAHHTPRQIPFGIVTTEATLQIFSFKIVSCELSWPLYVYGLVAVRDQVDDHRNILFERRRRSAQLVTRDVCIPSLPLLLPLLHNVRCFVPVVTLMVGGACRNPRWACLARFGQSLQLTLSNLR